MTRPVTEEADQKWILCVAIYIGRGSATVEGSVEKAEFLGPSVCCNPRRKVEHTHRFTQIGSCGVVPCHGVRFPRLALAAYMTTGP